MADLGTICTIPPYRPAASAQSKATLALVATGNQLVTHQWPATRPIQQALTPRLRVTTWPSSGSRTTWPRF